MAPNLTVFGLFYSATCANTTESGKTFWRNCEKTRSPKTKKTYFAKTSRKTPLECLGMADNGTLLKFNRYLAGLAWTVLLFLCSKFDYPEKNKGMRTLTMVYCSIRCNHLMVTFGACMCNGVPGSSFARAWGIESLQFSALCAYVIILRVDMCQIKRHMAQYDDMFI